MIAVEPHQAAACLRIRDGLRSRAKRLDGIEASDFQDPALAEIARDIHHRIHSGPGFCVLRGLPLAGMDGRGSVDVVLGPGDLSGRTAAAESGG